MCLYRGGGELSKRRIRSTYEGVRVVLAHHGASQATRIESR